MDSYWHFDGDRPELGFGRLHSLDNFHRVLLSSSIEFQLVAGGSAFFCGCRSGKDDPLAWILSNVSLSFKPILGVHAPNQRSD